MAIQLDESADNCAQSYYQINGGNWICGKTGPTLIAEFCSDKFDISVMIGDIEYPGKELKCFFLVIYFFSNNNVISIDY